MLSLGVSFRGVFSRDVFFRAFFQERVVFMLESCRGSLLPGKGVPQISIRGKRRTTREDMMSCVDDQLKGAIRVVCVNIF